MRRDIAIIGAGPSGLVAARVMAAAGKRVVVIDKGRGPGGRLSTRRFSDDLRLDHGCQFITSSNGDQNPVIGDLMEAGVISTWEPSVGSQSGQRISSDPEWHIGVPTMSSVPKTLAQDLEVQCGLRVDSLESKEDHWQLHGKDGVIVEASHVLVAIPSPQSVDLLAPVGFRSIEKLRRATYDPNWTLLVPGSLLEQAPFDVMKPTSGPLGWIVNQASKPGRVPQQAWIAQATTQWSQENLERSSEEVQSELLDALQEIVGGMYSSKSSAHRWRHALVKQPVGEPCLVDSELCLTACGDWCLGPTVGHAIESGLAAADEILKMMS